MKLLLLALLLILLLLQLRLWTGSGSIEDIQRLEREIASQQEQNAALQARNESMREEVKDLKTGLDSVEERARNELGLIREDETFYLILQEEGGSKPAAESAPPAAPASAAPRQP